MMVDGGEEGQLKARSTFWRLHQRSDLVILTFRPGELAGLAVRDLEGEPRRSLSGAGRNLYAEPRCTSCDGSTMWLGSNERPEIRSWSSWTAASAVSS